MLSYCPTFHMLTLSLFHELMFYIVNSEIESEGELSEETSQN